MSLSRNATINLVGAISPLAVTLATFPLYVKLVGEARFGVLSLVWLVFGYFGLFDFGLSRATSNQLARRAAEGRRGEWELLRAAIKTNLLLGVLAGALFYLACRGGLTLVVGKEAWLRDEASTALVTVSLLLPLSMLAGVFTGALESREKFLDINLQEVSGGVLIQALPLLAVLCFGPSLIVAVAGVFVARVTVLVWSAINVLRTFGLPPGKVAGEPSPVGALLRYGGWVTVSNAIGPLLVSLDQFVIARLLGSVAVTHYAIPFNLVMKALIPASSLARAAFPRMSRLAPEAARELSVDLTLVVALPMAAVCAFAIVSAETGLTLWIGSSLAGACAGASRILLVGAWLNGVAAIPFCSLQAQGRPEIVAKCHAIEIVPFVVVLIYLAKIGGIEGAALAWAIRALIDLALLLLFSGTLSRVWVPLLVLLCSLACTCWGSFGNSLPLQWQLAVATLLTLSSSLVVLGLSQRLRQHIRFIWLRFTFRSSVPR